MHIHLTLPNTVHEADTVGGNDHFLRHLMEVVGGHPCYWILAGTKTVSWRKISQVQKVLNSIDQLCFCVMAWQNNCRLATPVGYLMKSPG